jgi:transmembrane sensor
MERRHPNEISPSAPVFEQAASWWMLLNEGEPTFTDHHAFAEWLARSPERVEAYLQAARLTQVLTSRDTQWPDTPVEDLISAAKASANEVASLSPLDTAAAAAAAANRVVSTSKRAFGLPRLTVGRVAAVAIVAVAAMAIGLYVRLSPQRVETAVGEQRSVVLSDGSLVTLNTSSSIEVRMERDRRIVQLLAGEALFAVAHDAARPFEVMTGNTTVRAIGTQFNVDRRPASTTVTVVEGRVAVITRADENQSAQPSPLPLEAGEQLTLAPRSARHAVRTDVATAIAWTQRKLVFEHRHLGEVAEEFNRYNRQIIEIRSAELREQEVTGVFQANDPASFLTFVAGFPGVTIERSADRVVVTQQSPATTP